MLTSPLYAQKASEKLDASIEDNIFNFYLNREVKRKKAKLASQIVSLGNCL